MSMNIIKRNWLLVAILVTAGFLRFIGVFPGYWREGDEILYGQAVYMLENKTIWPEVSSMVYPPLAFWVNELVFLPIVLIKSLGYLLINGEGFAEKWDIFVFGKNWLNAMYWGRYIVAAVSLGSVYLIYNLAFVVFRNKMTALVSALTVALNYRLVLASHVGLIDTYSVFFLNLSLLCILLLLVNPSSKYYLLSFFSLSLAFLTKYIVYSLPSFAFVHLLLSLRQKNTAEKFKYLFQLRIVLLGLLAVVVVTFAHFGYFKNWEILSALNHYQALKYSIGSFSLSIYPYSYLYFYGLGPTLLILSLIGILFSLIDRNTRAGALVIVFAIIFILFVQTVFSSGGIYTRNLLVVIPLLLLFSSHAACRLARIISSTICRNEKMIVVVLAVVFLFTQAKNSIINSYAYSQTSPRTEAQTWIDNNIPNNSTFVAGPLEPVPINNSDVVDFPDYSEMFSRSEFLASGLTDTYALVNIDNLRTKFLWWMSQPPNIEIKFWNKPDDLLSQNYYSLALREWLWNYTQSHFLRPWQAPGYNYIVVKTSKFSAGVAFDQIFPFKDRPWKSLSYLPEKLGYLYVGPDGELVIGRNSGINISGDTRWESGAFGIKPGYIYKVTADVSSDLSVKKSSRDGFIRMDFYKEFPQSSILSRPLVSGVSGRYYGDGEPRQVEVSMQAPSECRYATVSFQADGFKGAFKVQNVQAYVSREEFTSVNGRHYTIDDNLLFLPNNGGIF